MALDGGGSEPKVVHVTIHTYGPSRTRKERRGNTIYYYHYVHIPRPSAADHPDGRASSLPSSGSGGGGGGGGGGGSGGSSRSASVIARQRFLRSLGYSVSVDGIWGPQSQRAWSAYLSGRGGAGTSAGASFRMGVIAAQQRAARARAKRLALQQRQALSRAMQNAQIQKVTPVKPTGEFIPGDKPMTREERKAVDKQFKADRKREAKAIARTELEAARIDTQLHLNRLYQRIQGNIQNARHFRMADIILMVNHGGFDTRDREFVAAVQTWLKWHGHRDLRVDGVAGSATQRALAQSFRRASRRETERQTEMIVRAFYDGGILKAGAPAPEWWPLGGRTPSPDQLRRLLQSGSFMSHVVWTRLQAELRNPYTQYLAFRRNEIRMQADSLFGPMGPTGVLGRATARIIGPEPEYLLMARVYGQQVANIYRNDSATDEQQANALKLLADQWQALNTSTTIDEYARRIARIEQIEELEWAREQARRAEDLPWWADTLETIMRPGEWARTQLIAEVKWLVDDPLGYLKYSGARLSDPAGYILDQLGYGDTEKWDKFTREENYYRMMAHREIEDSPFLIQLAYELVVDPINLIPVGGWAAKGVKMSMRAVSLSGRAGARVGQTEMLWGTQFGHALIDVGGRIDTLGLEGLYIPKGVRLAGMGIRQIPGVEKVVSKAGALKLDVVRNVQNNAQLGVLRNRGRVPIMGQKGSLDYGLTKTPDAKTLEWMQNGEDLVTGHLAQALDSWIKPLIKEGGSLYRLANRGDYSTIGSMIRGFSYEIIRIQETKRMAHEFAVKRREAFIQSLDEPAERERYLKFRRAFATESDDEVIERLSLHAYVDHFRMMLRQMGGYLKGISTRELDDILYKRVFAIADRFENHVLVHLQTMLEQAALKGEREMWDETGSWIGLGGKLEQDLKDLAAKSFDEENLVTRDNPLYGQVLNHSQFEERISSEIRRETARYWAWVGRARAEGKTITDEDIAKKLAAIEKEARRPWKRINRPAYRFRLNQDAMAAVREKLRLPDIPIEVKVQKISRGADGKWEWPAGKYEHGPEGVGQTGKITIIIPEQALTQTGGITGAKYFAREIGHAAAHEYRHAFQWDVDGGLWLEGAGKKVPAPFQPGTYEGYRNQPREIDANRVAEYFRDNLGDLASFERVPAGAYINTDETVKVSKLYARDLSESWGHYFDNRGDFSVLGNVGESGGMMQDLADVLNALGDSGQAAPLVAPNEFLRKGAMADTGFTMGKRNKPNVKFDQQEFVEAVAYDAEAVAKAYDQVVSQLYWENAAVFLAMTHSESQWQRRTVKTIQGMMDAWMLATLPLRPGWTVRNVIDNYVKSFVAGVRDPRMIFLGAKRPGQGITSIFGLGVREMAYAAYVFDRAFGTTVGDDLLKMSDEFFDRGGEYVGKVFRAHGVPVSDDVLEMFGQRPWELVEPDTLRGGVGVLRRDAKARGQIDQMFESGAGPRDFWVLQKELERKAAADPTGWGKAPAWYRSFREKAWDLMAQRPENYSKRMIYRDTYLKVQRRELDNGIDPITADMTAMKEAWEKVEATLFDYSKITVLEDNLRVIFPFVQFWRKNTRFWIENSIQKPWVPVSMAKIEMSIQQENEDLPQWMRRYLSLEPVGDLIAKVPGLGWVADYMQSLGLDSFVTDPMNMLSAAPLWRAFKNENSLLPGDEAGWRFVAPFLDALNDWGLPMNPFVRKALEGAGIANQRAWQTVFPQTALLDAFQKQYFDDNFAWIRDWEIVFQAGLGERPSNEIAENLNEYVQREMVNQMARGETVSRERALKTIQAFFWMQNLIGYTMGVYGRRITQEDIYIESLYNGERQPHLSPEQKALLSLWHKRGMTEHQFDAYLDIMPSIQAFYLQGDYNARQAYKKAHPEIIPYVDSAWNNDGRVWSSRYLATQQLAADSEAAMKMFELADGLDLSMETTRFAEQIFITPELKAYWRANDTGPEMQQRMVRGYIHRYYRDLAGQYYSIPDKDYAAKDGFLRENPHLMDYWSSFNSPDDDFAALLNAFNADMRDRYFEFVDDNDWDGANAFLERFPFIFDRVKDGKLIRDRETGRPDGRFSGRSQSQHAQDYLAAKKWLDYYFSLAQDARESWLQGGSAGANIVLEYFKKYSDYNQSNRGWSNWEDAPFMQARDADLAMRMKFWQRYFQLSPDARERFVQKHADDYGIFIYGVLSMAIMARQEKQYLRRAYAMGMTPKAAHYLYVKPMLDFFFTLGREQRKLFLMMNPELEEYFQKYAGAPVTGNPDLDKLIEKYFKLPIDSPMRSEFLEKHPEVQDYFDSQASPSERAIRALLEQYFDITSPTKRKEFLLKHPEVQAYFDKKAEQADFLQDSLSAFDLADPRLAPLLEEAAKTMTASQLRMLYVLTQKKVNDPDEIGVRYEREPAA